jgi:drug/metabolite transporter (DMT)-like permease
VLNGTYETLLPAIAASSAALTGLLFVAISVAGRRNPADRPVVVQQVRAAASILSFTNALAVALFGLVPGNNIGYPAIVVAVGGIFFTAAGTRSIFSSRLPRRYVPQQLSLIVALLVLFAFELAAGIDLLLHPHSSGAAELLGDLLVALLIIGIARAWELVGDRDTGIFTSIAVLAGRDGRPDESSGAKDGGK